MCPIYKYKREDGTYFKKYQSMDDDALEECPETGQPCKRVISGGITTIKKGTNWPDKQRKAEKRKDKEKRGEMQTTLPHYQKKVKENTEREKKRKLEQNS